MTPQESIDTIQANELMIGDWVEMKLAFGKHWFTDKVGCINPHNEMEYKPIPITAEILEKNGWDGIDYYRKLRYGYGYFNDDYRCEIALEENELCFFTIASHEYTICEIKGVHQLQHALRLCGLNELADNFVI